MKTYDIVCLGEISKDMIGTTKAFVETGTLLDEIYNGFGGRAANVAAFATIFGKRCLVVSPVGKDFYALGGARHMAKMKLDTSGLLKSKRFPTTLAIVISNVNYNKVFFYEGPLHKEYLEFKSHVISTLEKMKYKVLVATASRPEMNIMALKKASKGVLRLFMPSHEISYYTAAQLEECLMNCEVVRLNSAHVKVIESKLKMDIYSIIKKYKLRVAALTNGRDGSTVFAKYSGTYIPICQPDKEVDATGAGDSFTGAFIANYMDTNDEVYAGRLASSTASFTVQHVGVEVDIPTKKQIVDRAKLNYGNLNK